MGSQRVGHNLATKPSWPIPVDVWQKPIQFCKAIIFQLKNKYILKNRVKKKKRGEQHRDWFEILPGIAFMGMGLFIPGDGHREHPQVQ